MRIHDYMEYFGAQLKVAAMGNLANGGFFCTCNEIFFGEHGFTWQFSVMTRLK